MKGANYLVNAQNKDVAMLNDYLAFSSHNNVPWLGQTCTYKNTNASLLFLRNNLSRSMQTY